MDSTLKELERMLGSNKVRVNEPMSAHTTLKIGGPADYYVDVQTIDQLTKVVLVARKLALPVFVFGGGSNIVVSEKGISGLVIKNNCRQFSVMGISGKVARQKAEMGSAIVFAESGVLINQLVRFTIEEELEGLEYQLGLPGTVGGAIVMNSCYPEKSKFVGDALYKIKILTTDGEKKELDLSTLQSEDIILSAMFQLFPSEKKILWQKATEALSKRTSQQAKGDLLGCTYRNISDVDLIEKAGLMGKRIGDAMISKVCANFILNMGNAKAEDVLRLTEDVRREIFEKFGKNLKFDVKIVGKN